MYLMLFLISVEQYSTGGNFGPQGHLAVSVDTLGMLLNLWRWGVQTPTTEKYAAQNISSTKVEKLCSREYELGRIDFCLDIVQRSSHF